MNTENAPQIGVIFDVDGTMVNNTPYHRQAWFELCRRHNIELTGQDYLDKVHARSNDRIVPALFGPDVTEAFIRQIETEKETIYQDSFRPVLKEITGLTELLGDLFEMGIPLAAASNSPKTNVDFVLDGLGIGQYFNTVINRDMVQIGKPNPEVLLKSAAGLGCAPQNCLLFEDSPSGFAAARNAKMPYVVIAAATEPEELVQAHDAKAIYTDFTKIPDDFLSLIG
ncbi:MAG: HAD family hydrolase [Planctomycetota bacterium]|jgi:HAD superfamily hydrolase (TIGR01509 family)